MFATARRSGAFAMLCGGALLLCTTVSFAQTAGSDELFHKGREAAKRGDYAAACAFFDQSYALDPAAGTLFNLAHCQEQLRRVATAWGHYQTLSQRLDADDPRLERVRERIQALEPRLPRLTMTIARNASADLIVKLDGKTVAPHAIGAPAVLDPGNHTVEVSAPGRLVKLYELILAESESRVLELDAGDVARREMPAVAKPRPSAPPRPPPARSRGPDERGTDWQSLGGWSALGVGAAGLILSGVAAAIVLDRKAVVENECTSEDDGSKLCTPAGKAAADTGKTWGTVGTIAFVIGAAGVGAGSLLLLTADPSASEASVRLQARF